VFLFVVCCLLLVDCHFFDEEGGELISLILCDSNNDCIVSHAVLCIEILIVCICTVFHLSFLNIHVYNCTFQPIPKVSLFHIKHVIVVQNVNHFISSDCVIESSNPSQTVSFV
jgi:hypothetical protein